MVLRKVMVVVGVIDSYSKIQVSAAWTKSELIINPNFIYQLKKSDIVEINSALQSCVKLPFTDITINNFTLLNFSQTIRQKFLPQLETGIGVLLLKGLNTCDYTLDELSKIHWGLGLYFGRAQLQYGKLMLRIEDAGYDFYHPQARNNNTSGKLWFHNDSCDITAMMGIREAKFGGESQIVSSVAIHNKMVEEYPELVPELYQPYYQTYRNIANVPNKKLFYTKPVFEFDGSRFSCDMTRPTITNAQKLEGVPKLSAKQIKALDILEEYAECSELCHQFFLDPGDILYVNNHLLLHARQAFEDYDEVDKKRLLLRLHLSRDNNLVVGEQSHV